MEDSSYAIGRVLVFQVKKIHIAMIVLSVLMIPGAMTALEPIDMESYEMESPELTAQSIIEDEFSDSEIILGFMVAIRQPDLVPSLEEWEPVPSTSSGAADYANLLKSLKCYQQEMHGVEWKHRQEGFSTSQFSRKSTKNRLHPTTPSGTSDETTRE